MESSRFHHQVAPGSPEAQPDHETTKLQYEILNSPELRAKYITLTDGLISRLVEKKADVAVYLDKSARPVAWLVNELWETLAPRDASGHIPPKPTTKFLNIDREQWGPFIGRSEDETGGINVGRIPEENIDDLRQVFARVPHSSPLEDWSLFSGKNIIVVDEVRSSGDTLHMSEGILRRAFPDAAGIDGAYWMLKPAERDPRSGALISGEVPVWYSDRTNEGRLVANRDSSKSRYSDSSRQRHGALWLSTLFREGHDERGRQLKREIKQLAEDLRNHELPYMSSPEYPTKQIADRLQQLNNLGLEEYVKLRNVATHGGELDVAEFIELFRTYIHDRENQ